MTIEEAKKIYEDKIKQLRSSLYCNVPSQVICEVAKDIHIELEKNIEQALLDNKTKKTV